MIPLFVELCAGLASVSGVLQHGSTWKPPVSRMGRKTGYAAAILRVMGLRPRQKAARYLWAEADGDVAALLAAYTQPEVMREIAAIIRSWIPCPYGEHPPDPSCSRCKGTGRWDARDLWETLRRERRRGLWDGFDPASVATGLFLQSFQFNHLPLNFDTAGFMTPNPKGGRQTADRPTLADRCAASLPWPPVLIAQDARLSPGEVAGWAVTNAVSHPAGGFAVSKVEAQYGGFKGDGRLNRSPWTLPHGVNAFCCAAGVWPPVTLTPDARIQPAHIPPGTVVYIDPPYLNTTGYKHDLTRAEVLDIARTWQEAGARVYISEAEPIAALGWHHVEITGERVGQARTFGATPEWLTCSHPPAWTPPRQGGFGW